MERCLSLVLDRDDNISLTLEKMEAHELDLYISRNFNSSDDIRKKYKDVIASFLERYQNYLKDKTHKRGRIVITELQEDLTIEEKRVIYDKSLIMFYEITRNKDFIDVLQNRDYIRAANDKKYKRIFSEDYGIEIKFKITSMDKFHRVMGRWRNWIKSEDYYFEIVRAVLKEYEEIRQNILYKEYNFPTLDSIYNEYLRKKEEKKEQRRLEKLEKEAAIKEALEESHRQKAIEITMEEPIRYRNGADEDGYPGDLEPLETTRTEEIHKEEEVSKGKTKTLSNGHQMLINFED